MATSKDYDPLVLPSYSAPTPTHSTRAVIPQSPNTTTGGTSLLRIKRKADGQPLEAFGRYLLLCTVEYLCIYSC
jgi:hypothetical protein